MNELENPIGSGVELDLVPVACAMCGSAKTEPCPVFEGYDYEYRTCDNKFRFVACADCGHVYMSPRVRMEDIDRIYPRDYEPRNLVENYPVFRPYRWIKQVVFDRGWLRKVLVNLQEGSRVLEIGAGSGFQLEYLDSIAPYSLRLYANDLTFEAPFRASMAAHKIELIEGPIEQVNTGERFDAIICKHVIEHVVDPRRVFAWISDHLAPGGILYMETPDLNAPVRYLLRNSWQSLAIPRHFHLFSRGTIADLATGSGLGVYAQHALVNPNDWTTSIRIRLPVGSGRVHRALLGVFDLNNVLTRRIFCVIDLLFVMLGFSTSTQALFARKPAEAA